MMKMAGNPGKWLFLFLICYSLSISFSISITPPSKKTYIIHMSKSEKPYSFTDHLEWYSSKVKSAIAESEIEDDAKEGAAQRIIYNYDTAFHGFAAQLSQEEAKRLESSHGVLAMYPETVYKLHTTRSPEFLGLEPEDSSSIWSAALSDHDVIVGVLDTGIWPESPSFNDRGMAPVPARWKGTCETGRGFTRANCNRKIIGARMFYHGYEAAMGIINEKDEFKSPRDQDGHGTHTAATAVGSPVQDANLLGYARGTARGMAPGARVAAYKVCWVGGCFSSDILSAVDQAVADGVDVLSISLGGGVASYYRDSLSIAAFGAMEMGVFVSCSAGNGGPDPASLTNVSPWITTVGASTMDRDFPSTAKLGNGRILTGVSLYKGRRNLSAGKQYPLVYMGGNSSSPDPRSLCLEGTLDPHIVTGKIVICDRGISPRVQKGQVVKDAGGLGMILSNTEANGEELVADCHLLPTVGVGETAGKLIKHYVQTTPRPTATLTFAGTKLGIRPSPIVAAFSSRGPNYLTPEILKPDVVAPGVNILAAWSGAASPSSLPTDIRRVGFNILSGTSMSCPHVSGIAALLKASHPEWSPAAIKSALMTTAYIHDNTHSPLKDAATRMPSNHHDHGAGHINPSKAVDPGLVYDMGAHEYIQFLCSQKLTPMQLKVFTKTSNQSCQHVFTTPGDLNYPAISIIFGEPPSTSVLTVHRTVTNVGPPTSTYQVTVSPFKGAEVTVEPTTLHFTSRNQKLSYKVTVTTKSRQPAPGFGGLVWSDGIHTVRSPIVITWLS
ncbi:subtilisin-like protease SBT1.3 [Magnolia sinica]|uniref:subtilisin-like protease SBT1.3 n=1 Tax=Magnolia sinica TaxID=86752 RepID=UPI0026586652|nr:subtilisin-like protease SBT1.3 [Magnolia sinica]